MWRCSEHRVSIESVDPCEVVSIKLGSLSSSPHPCSWSQPQVSQPRISCPMAVCDPARPGRRGHMADWNSSDSTCWFQLLFLVSFTPNVFPGTAERHQKVQAKVRKLNLCFWKSTHSPSREAVLWGWHWNFKGYLHCTVFISVCQRCCPSGQTLK